MCINNGAVHQLNLLAHTVPVSVELDRDEVEMKVNKAEIVSFWEDVGRESSTRLSSMNGRGQRSSQACFADEAGQGIRGG